LLYKYVSHIILLMKISIKIVTKDIYKPMHFLTSKMTTLSFGKWLIFRVT